MKKIINRTPTQKELEFLLKYWQKALRLVDWEIKIKLVDREYMSSTSRSAEIAWKYLHRKALITMIRYDDWRTVDYWRVEEYDPEEDIVHELCHLILQKWDHKDDRRTKDDVELAINTFANSLVRLKRFEV